MENGPAKKQNLCQSLQAGESKHAYMYTNSIPGFEYSIQRSERTHNFFLAGDSIAEPCEISTMRREVN